MVQKSKDPTHIKEIKSERSNSNTTNLLEEKVTGSAAVRFYNLLKTPPRDPQREKLIKEALRLFPHPNNPAEIDVDLWCGLHYVKTLNLSIS
jgi:hypothetical protein